MSIIALARSYKITSLKKINKLGYLAEVEVKWTETFSDGRVEKCRLWLVYLDSGKIAYYDPDTDDWLSPS